MDSDPRADLFKLDSFSVDGFPCRRLGPLPYLRGVRFAAGTPITATVPLLRLTLEATAPSTDDPNHDKSDHGLVVPDFFGANEEMPIISKRMLAVLKAQADNYVVYPVALIDEESGREIDSHVAINVLGVVPDEQWCVDSSAIGPLRMFRMASYKLWVVDASIRQALIAAGIDTLRFRSLKGCAGKGDE